MKQVTRAIWSELLTYAPVFSTSQVAELAGVSVANASRDLGKLAERGMVTHVRRGLWAITSHPDFSPYAVVPHLFDGRREGYVSLLSALNLHGMIEQIPQVIQIMTTQQRKRLVTAVGAYEFHQIQRSLFVGFEPYGEMGTFDLATPEKALFDILYLSGRKGRRFSHLPELDLPDGFAPAAVERWIGDVEHEPLRIAIANRWMDLREKHGPRRNT